MWVNRHSLSELKEFLETKFDTTVITDLFWFWSLKTLNILKEIILLTLMLNTPGDNQQSDAQASFQNQN